MTREQFQRIALVTIVVLLATLASNQLMAYTFGHNDARHHRIVDVRVDHFDHWDEVDFDFDFDVEWDNDRCRFDLDRLRADANRMRAEAQRIQREVQVEQRQLSREAEQMRRMIRVEVN